MIRTLVSWTIWPLILAAMLIALVSFADVRDPQSLSATFTPVAIVLLLVALGIELVLPYRRDWNVSDDRDVWRDIGHLVLYSVIGGNIAGLVLLGEILWPVGAKHS